MTSDIAPNASQALTTERAGRVAKYVAASKAANTIRAYRKQWQAFVTFCQSHGYASLPAQPQAVSDYITHLADSGKRASTIQQAVAAIGYAHKADKFLNPCADRDVSELMNGIRRSLGVKAHQKAPITLDLLRLIVATCDDSLAGKRDKALILLGYGGAFRRSELAALTVDDIRITGIKATITIQRSKTDQEGQGRTKVIVCSSDDPLCPMTALRAWLSAAHITSGAIFRKVGRWQAVHSDAMNAQEVARITKRRAELAGLDPHQFAGHSLRSGFVTTAAENGAQQWEIGEQTHHKPGSRVLETYIRAQGRGAQRATAAAFGRK